MIFSSMCFLFFKNLNFHTITCFVNLVESRIGGNSSSGPATSVSKLLTKHSQIPPDATMYTNVANLEQTMLLQQKLFRQALTRQSSAAVTVRPHFTAPNLSQYHFVSSQEVKKIIFHLI